MAKKIKVAIIGSGNIGTDLMMKLVHKSKLLELVAVVGIDPDSEGLAKARALGLEAIDKGIDGLVASKHYPDIGIVFDATSAYAHKQHNDILQRDGKRVVDLTPAAVGPFIVPVVNMEQNIDAPNANMVTCGGQATIPMVAAVSRVARVPYAEIVASVSSRSAGPGTRANIDEFTRTTARGVEVVGGAERGKAIIILNPAEPPMIMRDTVFTLSDNVEFSSHRGLGEAHGRRRAGLCSGISPEAGGAVRALRLQPADPYSGLWRLHRRQDVDLPRGRGGHGALPCRPTQAIWTS